MKLGYWTPVYGGFLRNVGDESMAATWSYVRELSIAADRLGFHTTLVPELYLNDRKGIEAPSLEAWSLSTAILAVTERLRVMTAVRPGFHLPAVTAKESATIADIGWTSGSGDERFALNVVAAWWEEEAKQYGGRFTTHDARYDQASEFVQILRGLWTQTPYDHRGEYFSVENTILSPKPRTSPPIFAGGESEQGRESIAGFADSYALHGGTVEEIRTKVDDMNARRERLVGRPFDEFAMSAYVIVRDTEAEAQRELERITTVDPASPGYASFEEFLRHSQLDFELSRREYSVGTRGLRPNLVGTAEQVADGIRAFEEAGVTLLLIQSSPAIEELTRIGEQVLPLVSLARVGGADA
ncbi:MULTISPECIES: LLM class flavin-dependent oxidoreductase [unclassified Microbacterium]|uniref:LLM class flavin-dependent oxidoreductase n=1 Tax=unclassified Microbacterium TaxID=2609290 RepID=UPI000CFC9891|nr:MULTISPECIES: LLM class flavin-dependent oxidoreductase [unclassified Microbacterium]PQZ58254.1 alkanesulfonate monooxygenase [Microbacterium sp. MYb43]PQZ78350.1 alkanesulfonate monooxygenase [Microbacterium sp. MYb40]PRB20581.1 alkanesulfonate monooxygenase [Microbacterium sp. MYb54]PRB28334.1 alkanesulfonate monooxygenase [Microbacterium sp. MYb50]PRB66603.1 alkanesulfonate monooxygenase [Microbacterium sp. MYb24]